MKHAIIDPDDFDFKAAALCKEYFELLHKYHKKYNYNFFLLIQCGDFYEVYTFKSENEEYIGSNFTTFINICNLNEANANMKKIANKETGEEYEVFKAGFKLFQLEKYLNIVQQKGYTIIVYNQDTPGANSTRSLYKIISPGTFFQDTSVTSNSEDHEDLSNNIVSIWLELNKSILYVGMASIDIYTGKSKIAEYSINYSPRPDTYDELEKFISIFNPIEAIIISPFPEEVIAEIIRFIKLKSKTINKFPISGKKARNAEKQTYQKELLSKFFQFENYALFSKNFMDSIIATQSFCYLLDFIDEHNEELTRKLHIPTFENLNTKVILANSTLRQLNIIDTEQNSGKYSSIKKMLNNCITVSGKRHFNNVLLQPISDEIILNREYNAIDYAVTMNNEIKTEITTNLKRIADIQKLSRFITQKKITPNDILTLYKTLTCVSNIHLLLKDDKFMNKYLTENETNIRSKDIQKVINFLTTNFNLELCKNIKSYSNFPKNIINGETHEELFNMAKVSIEAYDKLQQCVTYFNEDLLGKKDFVKIKETPGHNICLICTIIRCKILEEKLDKLENKNVKLKYTSSFDNKEHSFKLNLEEIIYKKYTSTNNSLETDTINELCKNSSELKVDLSSLMDKIYIELLEKLQDFLPFIISINEYITAIDFLFCKANNSVTFNYCKPVIQASADSFIKAKGIRHPIVECIIDNFYIPGDIELGNNGYLIFSLNNGGKSTLIKTLGICVILAQAGMYVPCSEFIYWPYRKIFSRIVNSDNLFEGSGSFLVEMLEIKTILNMADNRSLILGNEPCSTSETITAKNIIVATLEHLSAVNSTYIFATHLHEIVNFEELNLLIENNKLFIKHLSVIYDPIEKKLIYNRKLCDGPGANCYGSDVIQILDMPDSFMKRVNFLRRKYYPSAISILDQETSKYNKEKIKGGLCQKCKNEMGSEMHHQFLQKDADANGFITTEEGIIFHKNHVKNLIWVCKSCHNEFHYGKKNKKE